MADLVPVRMRDCRCPGSPHLEGDFAYLKPKADVSIGLAAHQVISMGGDPVRIQVGLGKAYLTYGVVRWDILGENGRPAPVEATLETLDWADVMEVAEKAADLYGESVLAPLVARLTKATNGTTPESSQNGRTVGSTSAKTASSRSRRKP